MVKLRLEKIERDVMDNILLRSYNFYPNDPIEVCDPFYTAPLEYTYTDNIDWDERLEYYNNTYMEEIKQDELRYGYYLDMLKVKKEMEENPLIFDKEEEYYETDPHKLVNFDENFTPFFEKKYNDIFFHNLKHPLRLKWEEIPEEDRKQKIVHFDQAIRKIQYDEVERYFNKYLINKDLAVLFLDFMPYVWPISTFLSPFESYVTGKTPKQMYDFFIERIVLLGSAYTTIDGFEPITAEEKEVAKYMNEVERIKEKMFKDLLACIKTKPVRLLFKPQETEEQILRKSHNLSQPDVLLETDIFTRFIQKYKLYVPDPKPDVVRVYNYPEISKLIILLNLSFFNIFPISTKGYEEIRISNRVIYVHFLWYLKDFFWKGHESTLKVKEDIQNFLSKEDYSRYSHLLDYYPGRMVAAKEYFYTYHNTILREVAVAYLEDYFEKEEAQKKIEYRHNADFYILNQALQAYEKEKEKIYSKSRKLNRTQEEINDILERSFKRHQQQQRYMSKFLFRSAKKHALSQNSQSEKTIKKIMTKRDSLDFYIDQNEIITKTYAELIKETKDFFIDVLKALGAYDELCEEYKEEPKKYNNPKMKISTKLLDKKLIEPNLWNKFDDYCHLAFDKYPDKITDLSTLSRFQKMFVEEFLRDIMFFWGHGNFTPPEFTPLLTSKRRLKSIKS